MSLLRQAHVEGLLDCREARQLDRNWHTRLNWTLDWVEERNRNEVRRLRHEMNCALLNYSANQEAVDLHWDQAHAIQGWIAGSLLPWEKGTRARLIRERAKEMTELWKKVWGDPKDPDVARKIQQTADALNAMAAEKSRKPGGRR